MSSPDAWHRSRAPEAKPDVLRRLVQRHWGFSPDLQPLYGERDFNARILTPDGTPWLLKLSHPDTTSLRLSFEQRVFEGLARQPGAPVTPSLLPTLEGASLVPLTLDSGEKTHLRILRWLPGEPLDSRHAPGPMLEALGAACARLNEALAACDLSDPGDALPRNLPWDLQNTSALAELLEQCAPVVPRDAVRRTLDQFRAHVSGPLAELPRQVVHNDLNPDNLRFDPREPAALPGIIDFGDMVLAPVICDLAIACAYVVGQDPDTCLDRVIPVVRGFHRVRPLAAREWSLLPRLLEARLCQSLVIQGARISDAHPDAQTLIQSLRGHARRLQILQQVAGDRSQRLSAAVRDR